MHVFRNDPNNRHCVHPDDVLRVDRQILLCGSVAMYHSRDRLRQHIVALESYGYRCPSFDCSEWDSDKAMYSAFSNTLNFPDYYRHCLDALEACLGDLEIADQGGVALTLWQFDHFARQSAKHAWNVLDLIAQTSWVHQLYSRRLLALIHSDDPELRFAPIGGHTIRAANWEARPPDSESVDIDPSPNPRELPNSIMR